MLHNNYVRPRVNQQIAEMHASIVLLIWFQDCAAEARASVRQFKPRTAKFLIQPKEFTSIVLMFFVWAVPTSSIAIPICTKNTMKVPTRTKKT